MKQSNVDHFKMLDDFSKKMNGINFIAKIIDNYSKLSFTLKTTHLKFFNFNGIEIDSNDSELCFGLQPIINSSFIIDQIKKGLFKEKKIFDSFIELNPNLFLMHKNDIEFIRGLYAKSLVRAASRFGYHFDGSIISKTDNFHLVINDLMKSYKHQILFDSETQSLYILGSATQELLLESEKNGLRVINDNQLVLNGDSMSLLETINSNKIPLKLINAEVHYSGVLPRLNQIIGLPNNFSNIGVDQYCLEVERTTFFTVDTFDHYEPDTHSFLDEYIDIYKAYYKFENELIENLYLSLESGMNKFDAVNCYLQSSRNTHIIGVTANLETLDGYLLISERSKKSIDSFQIYPSVNGQSEFYDPRVDFYNNSVGEDTPH